jgi:hypothetical protein
MIKHKFILSMNGIIFEKPVSFSKISERFRNVTISENPDGDLELIVVKQGTRSLELLTKEAKIEANELVDRLSILESHRVRSMSYIGYYDSSEKFVPYEEKQDIKRKLFRIIRNPEFYYSQDTVKTLINSKKHSGILRIFRTALGINDRISQYLIFYGLLLILKGEKQGEVDKYIKKEIPDILIVSGNHGDETIITNIRNMIAHPPKDLDMTNLINKVNDYLDELKKLVVKSLREN